MPTYEYACPDCGAAFERVQKFTDKPIKKCPACGKNKVHRVVGRIAVSFKGSGFYVNDSKSSSSTSKEPAKPKDEKAADEKPGASETADTSTTAEAPKPSGETTAASAPDASAAAATSDAKPAKAENGKKAKSKKD